MLSLRNGFDVVIMLRLVTNIRWKILPRKVPCRYSVQSAQRFMIAKLYSDGGIRSVEIQSARLNEPLFGLPEKYLVGREKLQKFGVGECRKRCALAAEI